MIRSKFTYVSADYLPLAVDENPSINRDLSSEALDLAGRGAAVLEFSARIQRGLRHGRRRSRRSEAARPAAQARDPNEPAQHTPQDDRTLPQSVLPDDFAGRPSVKGQ